MQYYTILQDSLFLGKIDITANQLLLTVVPSQINTKSFPGTLSQIPQPNKMYQDDESKLWFHDKNLYLPIYLSVKNYYN